MLHKYSPNFTQGRAKKISGIFHQRSDPPSMGGKNEKRSSGHEMNSVYGSSDSCQMASLRDGRGGWLGPIGEICVGGWVGGGACSVT